MNKPTVQDIFLRFYPAYLEKYSPSPEQAKVSRNIINCKTGAYGANVSICEDCGTVQIHYNSCRNRCCPMCQAVPKEMWMDARREDVLDAPYFHLVFTVPDILNPVIYSNQKQLYDTLYHAASATISELAADPKHLGASVGYICILHTWGSEMNFHPHIHTILLGGGLTPKNEWKDNGTEFFLPIQVISKVFRGKYMEELKNLWETDRLEFHGTAEKYRNHYAFKELLDTCYSAEWIPYCKNVVPQNKIPVSCAKTANYNRIFINLSLTVCQKNGTLFFLCVSEISVIVVLVATDKKRERTTPTTARSFSHP